VPPGQPLEVEVELARRDGGVIDDEIRLEMKGPDITWTPGAQANNRRRGTLSCDEAGERAGATVALYRKGKRIWHLDGVVFGCGVALPAAMAVAAPAADAGSPTLSPP